MPILENIRNWFVGKEPESQLHQQLESRIRGLEKELKMEQGDRVSRYGSRDEITESRISKRSPFSPYFLDWVPWGQFNLLPQTFKDLLGESPAYARISTSLANMAQGQGLQFEGNETAARSYFENIGIDRKFIEKAVWDVVIFNAFSCQVIRDSRSGIPARVVHQRVENVRSGKANELGDVEFYYLARDWSLINTMGQVDLGRLVLGGFGNSNNNQNTEFRNSFEVRKLPIYRQGTNEDLTLIYSYRYSPATNYYPVPLAEPAEDSLKLQTKFHKYHNNQIDNGAASGALIFLPTFMGADYAEINKQMEKTSLFIRNQIGGIENAGKPVLIPYEQGQTGGNKPPEIHSPPFDQNDKKYVEIMEQNRIEIFTALGVIAPDLYGVSTASGFASQADMLLTAYNLTLVNIIKPLQDLITEPLNDLLEAAGIAATVDFLNEFPFDIEMPEADAEPMPVNDNQEVEE